MSCAPAQAATRFTSLVQRRGAAELLRSAAKASQTGKQARESPDLLVTNLTSSRISLEWRRRPPLGAAPAVAATWTTRTSPSRPPRGSRSSAASTRWASSYGYGFEKPSAIQQRAVLPIISGRDVIAQAQSGTGKTSVICLTVCQIVDTAVREVQALILSPTRELASQTERVMLAIGDFLNIQVHSCIGGKSIGEDIRRLEHGVHVVSGTPGRVCDMIKRRTLRTRAIKLLILDEADEMLNRGFKDQIYDVYRYLPPELQVDWLTERMRSNSFTVSAMHRDMPQQERDAIMAEFRFLLLSIMISQTIVSFTSIALVDLVVLGARVWRSILCARMSRMTSVLRDIEQYYSTQIDEMPTNVTDLI
ncbi:hypothetical protein EJB05_27614, partial [Eragrostis curvula]